MALLAALPASAQPAAASVSIDIGDDWFCASTFEKSICPRNLIAGDVVTWNYPNTGDSVHTVTQCQNDTFSDSSCSGGWDSGILDAGQSFQRSFNSSGTIYYRCNIHPTKMRGRLDVSAAPAPTATPAPAPTPTPPPPPSSGEPAGGGGAATGGGTSTSGEASTSAGTTAGEPPSPTAQPPGADPSPTPSPGGRTTAITQVTPTSDVGEAQAPIDDSGGGSSLWLYALIAIGGLALLAGSAFAFRRYRHQLFRHD